MVVTSSIKALRQLGVRWLPLLVWMALIFAVSDRTPQELPSFGTVDTLVKKAGHLVAYALLGILAYWATAGRPRSWLWALAITAVYAASDELHQTFVPGRYGAITDVFIDCLGGIVGLSALRLWQLRHRWRWPPLWWRSHWRRPSRL